MNAAPAPSASRDEDSMRTMWPDSEPELGRIDQYAVLRRLGGGGYGVVYLARDTVSGVLFALKTLHPLVKRNPEELERVRRSFALVSGLAHDGIAGARVLHEVRAAAFSDETARRELLLSLGDFVMVLTYAPGVTLSAWARQFPNGVAPLARALEVGAQVAAALDYAHGKGVVHRDVKPGNVMVETLAAESPQALDHGHGGALPPGAPKIRVRILDFGLAAEIRSSLSRVSNEKGDVSGTRPYMAPEQWRGKKQDGRTDQYALACMLYELLSGDPPFAGAFETGDEAIMRSVVLNEAPDPVEGLSPAANAALLRALSKDPKERFPTCAAFVAALEGGDGSTSRPPDGRAAGASLPETARGEGREEAHAEIAESVESGSPSELPRPGARASRPRSDGPARSEDAPRQATLSVEDESALFARKISLAKELAAVPDADRSDTTFGPLLAEASQSYEVGEEALRFSRFPAAASCFDQTQDLLGRYRAKRDERREAERKAAEEAAKRARRQREAERRLQWQAQENVRAVGENVRKKAAEEAETRRRFGIVLVVAGLLVLLGIAFFQASSSTMTDRYEGSVGSLEETDLRVSIAPVPSNPTEGAPLRVTVGRVAFNHVMVGRVAFNVRWCPPDSFTMGSPESEDGHDSDEKQHRVTFTKGFWMGETEVTQGLWKEVMGANPSSFQSGDDYPVENVSWNNCQDFLRKLNAKAPQGWWFVLPTEAQWEYACRAGSSGPFSGTGCLDDMGWHDSNSDGKTHPVAQKKANAWGLFDMHGNVWEWCADGYGSYPSGTVTNPFGSASGSSRVSRGGSWRYYARHCRSANRDNGGPGSRRSDLGFRVALVPVQ